MSGFNARSVLNSTCTEHFNFIPDSWGISAVLLKIMSGKNDIVDQFSSMYHTSLFHQDGYMKLLLSKPSIHCFWSFSALVFRMVVSNLIPTGDWLHGLHQAICPSYDQRHWQYCRTFCLELILNSRAIVKMKQIFCRNPDSLELKCVMMI